MVRCMGRAIRSHVEQRPDAGASFTPAGIFARTELQRLNPGSGLFREGESPSGVYVLHSGEVALTGPPGAPSRPGRTARAGEILGLMAVISNGRHLATAVALTICEVGFIERKEFLRMVEASPSIWFSVLRQMSQDLNASYDVMRVYSERGRC